MSRRQRGVVLTDSGKARVEAAITLAQDQEKYGARFTQAELEDRVGRSIKTIKRILDQRLPTDEASVKALFAAFENVGLTLEPADYGQAEPDSPTTPFRRLSSTAKIDWGEKPDTAIFFGRTEELATLSQWIVTDRCRLVTLLGMGGIGKTSLVAKLATQLTAPFDYIIWRSLREAPPLDEILVRLIQFLSDQQETEINLPARLGERIIRLLHYLREHRCLVVLDNLESILQPKAAGRYREGYEDYGELIQSIGSAEHQSCLLLTSRECPRELTPLAGAQLPVRLWSVSRLDAEAGRQILQAKGVILDEAEDQGQELIQRCSGNPQALHLVATAIQREFLGDVDEFLQEQVTTVEDVRTLLDQHLNRLAPLERSVLFWLAIHREPVGLDELMADLLPPVTKQAVRGALAGLRDRYLIETVGKQFTLQNVIMEFTTDRFVEQVSRELETQAFDLFHTHALIQATAKDYVRETQVRLLLKPVITSLANLAQTVSNSLETIRQHPGWDEGYAAGNLLNLLCQSQTTLQPFDFSQLTLRQAHLKGAQLHGFNLANTQWIEPELMHQFGFINSVAYSPDGQWLASGGGDCGIRLWQIRTGRCHRTFTGHTSWVRSVTFSPDGQWLASGSDDATIRLWQVSTGQCLKTLTGHSSWVRSVIFSPDGQWLASGSGDATIRIWQVNTGKCCKTLPGLTDWINSVAFSPDGQWLATGSEDATCHLWQVSTGECCKTLTGHTGWVNSVAFSPDGQWLASSSGDATIRLWQVSTGECCKTLTGHTGWVNSVAFSPGGQWLVSGGEDATIRLWWVSTGECHKTLIGHISWVNSITVSPDGQWLASGGEDAAIRLWQVNTGECHKTLNGHTSWVTSVVFSPDDRWLVTGSADITVRLWQMSTGQCHQTLSGHTNWVRAAVFSPDGEYLATGSDDATIRLWQVSTGQNQKILIGHTNRVRSVAFSPDGQCLATGSTDNTIRLWQVSTGQCINTLIGHTSWVNSVVFSPDGQWLASGSEDATVRLWKVSTGQCHETLTGGKNSRVRSVMFSPDGQWLATGSTDTLARLWKVGTGQCSKTLIGHTDWVNSVRFSPDGQWLATCSADSNIRLWQVSTGQCHKVLTGHTAWLRTLAFSADGQWLASGGGDATIGLWQVSTGECLSVWQIPRPYEGTDITGARGLTEAQRASFLALGAVCQ